MKNMVPSCIMMCVHTPIYRKGCNRWPIRILNITITRSTPHLRTTTLFPTINESTLLENTINRSIQNDVYANKATYYKQSKFYITSSISELVNLGQDTAINRTNSLLSSWSDWNKQAIEERQEMFYRLSEMIWELR